jgi:peptidoglycan/LPS O-acetylase OafA/YrhL
VERPTSVYLDLVRFTAALVVFVGHVSGARFTAGFLWQVGPYMEQAVAVFFVLSGYVIGYVTTERETNAATYAMNRLARVASVCLPAVALTLALDAIGRSVSPGLYSAQWGYASDDPLLRIATAVTFTQSVWWSDLSIGSNLPYWSLNYEVAYYVMFGVAAFCGGRRRAALLLLLACCYGPPILMLLPLWLLGLVTFRLGWRPGRLAGWLLFAGSSMLYGGYEAWAWHSGRPLAALGPPSRPDLPQDYLVAALFAANLAGIRAIAADIAPLARRVQRPIRWLAGRTFSLYLFHLPVAQFLAAINPLPPGHPLSRIGILGVTFLLVLLLAEITELRKDALRRWLAGRLPRMA